MIYVLLMSLITTSLKVPLVNNESYSFYIVKGESRAVAWPNCTDRKHYRMREGYCQLKLTYRIISSMIMNRIL